MVQRKGSGARRETGNYKQKTFSEKHVNYNQLNSIQVINFNYR